MGNQSSRQAFIRQLLVTSDAAAQVTNQRTLVVVFLRGAADTLNMIVPYGDDHYYHSRPTIGITAPTRNGGNESASLKLDEFYAFHPKLGPLLPVFNEGRLGIVQAVGTDNPTGSHFEAQDQMEHGESYGHVTGGGWLGRYLRTLNNNELTPLSAVAIGSTIPEALRGSPTPSAIESIDEVQIKTPLSDTSAVSSALAAMYGSEVGAVSESGKSTLELLKRVETLRGTQYKPDGGAVYPAESFGQGLKEVARLIKANVGLRVACLDLGNWDTHFFQGGASGLQADLIAQLASGLAAFDADLISCRDRVLTLVMTEFGRRTYENGSLGTDHGRGFAMLGMGAALNGGRVHGKWPGLIEEETSGSSLNIVGPSGLKILFDYRSVLSEALTTFLGLRDVQPVFPNFQPQPVGLVR